MNKEKAKNLPDHYLIFRRVNKQIAHKQQFSFFASKRMKYEFCSEMMIKNKKRILYFFFFNRQTKIISFEITFVFLILF